MRLPWVRYVNCLDCGCLHRDQKELIKTHRPWLRENGYAYFGGQGIASAWEFGCVCQKWEAQRFAGSEVASRVLTELTKARKCKHYIEHNPGRLPEWHRERHLHLEDQREQQRRALYHNILVGLVVTIIGVLATMILYHLGYISLPR